MLMLRCSWHARHRATCWCASCGRRLWVYASADYLAAHGAVAASGDLTGRKIIGFFEEERPLGPVWWLSRAEKAGQVMLRSSSVATRLSAVKADVAWPRCLFYRPTNPSLQPVLAPIWSVAWNYGC